MMLIVVYQIDLICQAGKDWRGLKRDWKEFMIKADVDNVDNIRQIVDNFVDKLWFYK